MAFGSQPYFHYFTTDVSFICSVFQLCSMRKAKLEESLQFFQFLQDSEEEEAWLVEKMRIVKSTDVGKDLRSIISIIRKHEV